MVREILHFLYCSKVSSEFSHDILDEVLCLAEMLNIPDLKAECGYRMEKLLNSDNAEEIAEKAEKYNMEHLSRLCLGVMVGNLNKSSAISVLLKSRYYKIRIAQHMTSLFVAENIAFFRESGDLRNLPLDSKRDIMFLLEQGILVSKMM